MSAAPLVRLRGAAFGYRGRAVLSGVDLEVRPGELVGLVGPNGSGKTTLLRGLLGLVPPLAGAIERADVRVGLVPQREVLDRVYPLSVRDVAEMGAWGRPRGPLRRLAREDRELAAAALARVGLAARARDLFAELSGGQRQRALIARALVERPALLALDEPTSGVDRGAEEAIVALLRELAERDGVAVLMVTHRFEALRGLVADAIVVDGGTARRGPAEALLADAALARLFGTGGAGGGR